MIITIEGVDQSGKTVQAAMLAGRLRQMGVQTSAFDFPDYATKTGRMIRECLDGRGAGPGQLHALLAQNRGEKLPQIRQALARREVIVMNRYCESNLIYGSANGLDVQWLRGLDRAMPESDMVILLDITAAESFRRKSDRDAFEADKEFMERVVASYREHSRQERWRVVEGTGRPEAVHQRVWDVVWPAVRPMVLG